VVQLQGVACPLSSMRPAHKTGRRQIGAQDAVGEQLVGCFAVLAGKHIEHDAQPKSLGTVWARNSLCRSKYCL
jgi:hypothetical protein